MKPAVTIKEIAEQLGLSRNTVAKVLNGNHVREKTRDLVLSKARELNYKSIGSEKYDREPKSAPKSKRILMFLSKPSTSDGNIYPIMHNITDYCKSNNHTVLQFIFDDNILFNDFTKYVKHSNIDGIIAVNIYNLDLVQNLIKLNYPICFIDFPVSKKHIFGNYDIVKADNTNLTYNIVNKIYNQHKFTKFCFVGEAKYCLSFNEMYSGMLQALATKNIPHDRQLDDILYDVKESDRINNIRKLLSRITELRTRPDCFICANDSIAYSVYSTLQTIGKHSPIVGFGSGNETICSATPIKLYECDTACLGTEAASALLDRISRPQPPATRTITVSQTVKPQ